MLVIFDTSSAIPFFPARWANSVTRWLTGLYSPNRTISISNTVDPTENGGCAIDVNVDQLYNILRERMARDFVPRSGLKDNFDEITDRSFKKGDGRIGVDPEEIERIVEDKNQVLGG